MAIRRIANLTASSEDYLDAGMGKLVPLSFVEVRGDESTGRIILRVRAGSYEHLIELSPDLAARLGATLKAAAKLPRTERR